MALSDGADKPLAATGYYANAILVIDGKPRRFPLSPGENGHLVRKAAVAAPAGVKAAVQIIALDGATSQAKF